MGDRRLVGASSARRPSRDPVFFDDVDQPHRRLPFRRSRGRAGRPHLLGDRHRVGQPRHGAGQDGARQTRRLPPGLADPEARLPRHLARHEQPGADGARRSLRSRASTSATRTAGTRPASRSRGHRRRRRPRVRSRLARSGQLSRARSRRPARHRPHAARPTGQRLRAVCASDRPAATRAVGHPRRPGRAGGSHADPSFCAEAWLAIDAVDNCLWRVNAIGGSPRRRSRVSSAAFFATVGPFDPVRPGHVVPSGRQARRG